MTDNVCYTIKANKKIQSRYILNTFHIGKSKKKGKTNLLVHNTISVLGCMFKFQQKVGGLFNTILRLDKRCICIILYSHHIDLLNLPVT